MAENTPNLNVKAFLEGPAGSGKTTYATGYLERLIESGVAPDRILILVPQVTLGRPYEVAIHRSPVAGGRVDILTLAGIARGAVETYWPLIGAEMGFADPNQEPTFLNIETAQYFMARLANEKVRAGIFSAVNVSPQRIVSQVLDNLNKAAILRFPLDEVATRLTLAWGNRHSSRPPVYAAAVDLAKEFRVYCLEHNLLDFSLSIEAFNTILQQHPRFIQHFMGRYRFLIADNIEENTPAAHDFIRWMMPYMDGALLIYDSDAGYRIFLGADAETAHDLAEICDIRLNLAESKVSAPALVALGKEFNRGLGPTFEVTDLTPQPPLQTMERESEANPDATPLTAFTIDTTPR
jgi:hypothetical protein